MDRLLAQHVPDSVSLGDRLKTFSAVFPGDPIDERRYIEAVLAVIAADPTFIEPTSEAVARRAGDLDLARRGAHDHAPPPTPCGR